MPNLMTKKAVCAKVGISRAQLDRWTNDPAYAFLGFPRPVRIGIKVLYAEHEIDAWIDQHLARRSSA